MVFIGEQKVMSESQNYQGPFPAYLGGGGDARELRHLTSSSVNPIIFSINRLSTQTLTCISQSKR